jgi:hypothetical protein
MEIRRRAEVSASGRPDHYVGMRSESRGSPASEGMYVEEDDRHLSARPRSDNLQITAIAVVLMLIVHFAPPYAVFGAFRRTFGAHSLQSAT